MRFGPTCTTSLVVILVTHLGVVQCHSVPQQRSACGQQYGLWPLPAQVECTHDGDVFELRNGSTGFNIKLNGATSESLQHAASRVYNEIFNGYYLQISRGPIEPHLQNDSLIRDRGIAESPTKSFRIAQASQLLRTLVVEVRSIGSAYKTVKSDESYELNISSAGAIISANETWGAIYGLETFAQLISYQTTSESAFIQNAPVFIRDRPRYPWRGLLVDTANHFIPVEDLKLTIDALGRHKMNVFHWHIVDSYSFPMISSVYPQLSAKGAWSPEEVYTKSDVASIIEYANNRGIRVLSEVDTPGHAYSLGLAFPNITVDCGGAHPDTDIGPVNIVPLDPSNNFTYEVISNLIGEFASTFPDAFLHVGGDELQTDCWETSDKIRAFMEKNGMKSFTELQAYFETKMMETVNQRKRVPIVWADTFQEIPHTLPANTVVQVWENMTLLNLALQAGHDTILSLGWYLDRQEPVDNKTGWFWLDTWSQMYEVEPDNYIEPSSQNGGHFLGGEANMWSEQVSSLSIHQRIWPRTSGIAERLWSPKAVNMTGDAATRLARHRCRMAASGLQFGPIWADYCSADVNRTHVTQMIFEAPNDDSWIPSAHAVGAAAISTWAVAGIILWICLAYQSTEGHRRDEERDEFMGLSVSGSTLNADDHDLDRSTRPLLSVSVKERIKSLDVFRGLNIALMVFVDDVGSSFPEIHHSPWNGIRLADFVMPFFDFMVGVSMAMSLKKVEAPGANGRTRFMFFRKASIRFAKIFLIGVWTQGGLSLVEFNLSQVRIMGILQRVAVCYYATALLKIYLPCMPTTGISISGLFRRYTAIWVSAVILMSAHSGIMYGVHVTTVDGMECGRGNLTPVCNAATYIDRHVFGVNHMYFPTNGGDSAGKDMTYQRLPECSGCSPGKCAKPHNATIPEWCNSAPFDPEGLVSSLNAIITTIIGLHYGHVLVHVKNSRERMTHWLLPSIVQLVVGLTLHFTIIPMNTDLYSISYLFVSGGAAGFALIGCYWIVDYKKIGSRLWRPFMYAGMNAIMMYLFMEGDFIDCPLSFFYIDNPDNSLQNILWPTGTFWGDDDSRLPTHASHNPYVMSWTIVYIAFWMTVAWGMHLKKVYVKI